MGKSTKGELNMDGLEFILGTKIILVCTIFSVLWLGKLCEPFFLFSLYLC